jgi:heptosyltransferase II
LVVNENPGLYIRSNPFGVSRSLKKVLIIQTAFIGDVILSTALLEKLHQHYPDTEKHFLLRKGNESILAGHPYIQKLLIWDKKKEKVKNLFRLLKEVRKEKYDLVICLQRFAGMGLLTALSNAEIKIGFDKNPFSRFFTRKVPHIIGEVHEVERNNRLIEEITDKDPNRPVLYPSEKDLEKTDSLKSEKYICAAPTSVWFTKQFPAEKWIEFFNKVPSDIRIYLLGAPPDWDLCERIKIDSGCSNIVNLSGELSLLQSAALMKDSIMNYVNDSAPLHISSSMNAPTCAVFCSTVPGFGFGPLSDVAFVVETDLKLSCKPCGLHGYRKCPLGHFNCAFTVDTDKMVAALRQTIDHGQ